MNKAHWRNFGDLEFKLATLCFRVCLIHFIMCQKVNRNFRVTPMHNISATTLKTGFWINIFSFTFPYRLFADTNRKMPIFYLMYFAMQKLIYFNQKPLIVLLLISSLLLELNAFGHEESSLGTFMIKSPESTDAPPGDEVQLQCELNLPPEKLEFRFRPQNSSPEERDRLINIHKMVRIPRRSLKLSRF